MADQEQKKAETSVFISYSRKDIEFVRKLNDGLDSNKVDAWVDWEGIPISADWREEITRAVQASDAFLFVISPDSLASKVCMEELEMGIQYNKKLIPVLHRMPAQDVAMHEKLSAHNWVYMRAEDDFDATLQKLIEAVRTDLEWVRQHTRILRRATEWDGKKRNSSFLLQGADLEEAQRWMVDAASKPNRDVVPLQAEYILASRVAANRKQRNLLVGVSLALVVSIALGIIALFQRSFAVEQQGLAENNAATAVANANIAATARAEAVANEAKAKENEVKALQNENSAKAERSSAYAQTFQGQAGQLETSTLLAIDAYQREPTFQAEEILRHNLSLLPVPLTITPLIPVMGGGSESIASVNGRQISSILYNPDGSSFIAASFDGSACLWDVGEITTLRFCVYHDDVVSDVIFSKGARTLITASLDKSVRVWDASNGDPLQRFDFEAAVMDIDLSPDERWVAVAREDPNISVIDLKNNTIARRLSQFGGVYTIEFNPDGNWLAIGTTAGNVRLWQFMTEGSLAGPQHNGEVYVVAYSPDGKWIVSVGSDSRARLGRTSTGGEIFSLPHNDWVEDIAFSPDGTWFVTVSDDNQVRVWDTLTGREKLRMMHQDFVQEVKISADGQWIATASKDRTARVWSAASGAKMLEIPLEAAGTALAFSPDSTRLVIGDSLGNIRLLDISVLASRQGYLVFPELAHEAIFSPSGEWLAINSDDRHVWLVDNDQILNTHKGIDGTAIITSQALTYDMAFSPDSKWIAAVETDQKRAILYNIVEQSSTILLHDESVKDVSFSPDSEQVALAGEGGLIIIYDVQIGTYQLLKNTTPAFSLTYSPDGKQLVVGLQGSFAIWDPTQQTLVREIEQTGETLLVAFSQDGKWLVTASSLGTICIWDVQSSEFDVVHTRKITGLPLSASFSGDNRWLAIGGSEGFAYLWDVNTGEEMARIPHSFEVSSVSFSSDSSLLATVSRKVVNIWNVAALPLVRDEELLITACSRLTRNIDKAQWENLFYDEPYRLICPDLPEGK